MREQIENKIVETCKNYQDYLTFTENTFNLDPTSTEEV